MIDDEKNLATWKIHEESHEWARAEQERVRSAEKKKLTQAELFDRMRSAYGQRDGNVGPQYPIAHPVLVHRHAEQHELLDFILDNGTPEQAEWIAGNLKTFAKAIELDSPKKRQRRA